MKAVAYTILFCLFAFLTSFCQSNDSTTIDTTAFIPISGILPPTIEPQTRPYLAVGDLQVPFGSTVKIKAGVHILFNTFTGIQIRGVLIAEGTEIRPVVFTSINDSVINAKASEVPAAFDWNGIDIYDQAVGTAFTWCRISYSVYGLRAQTDQFRLSNCLFNSNGNGSISINGENRAVENKPFSYRSLIADKPSVFDNTPKPVVVPIQKPEKKKNVKLAARIAYCVIGCAGFGLGALGTSRFRDSNRLVKEMEENKIPYTSQNFKDAQNNQYIDAAMMGGGYALGLTGATVFIWLCSF